MSKLRIHPTKGLRGSVSVPGDKSISHRALLLNALASGISKITGFLPSGDCMATVNCVKALGVKVETQDMTTLLVHGGGLHGLRAPINPLDCVRSGTTMRLLTGILSGQSFDSVLIGNEQLLRRPMLRVSEPLSLMGAKIETTFGHAPLTIRGGKLISYSHTLTVASAQVKSALLLAGLYAKGTTTVHQPGPARDHTERMLAAMGAEIEINNLTITIHPPIKLSPLSIHVPGDLSSAAFLLVAAILVPNSKVTIKRLGVNPTRTGLLDVLRKMGTEIIMENNHNQGNEPISDLTISTSNLVGVEIGGETVVRMIDEFPILAVAATQAQGTTVVCNASELRVKETDRIANMVTELQILGAHIEPLSDGFIIKGPTPLNGAVVKSYGDHRLAMALEIAGLIAKGEVVLENIECIDDSFPGFTRLMQNLGADYD